MPVVRGVDLRRELAHNPPADLSAVRARLRRAAIALIQAEDLVEATYSYRIVPLDEVSVDVNICKITRHCQLSDCHRYAASLLRQNRSQHGCPA